MAKCKSGFKEKDGKCVRTSFNGLFKGFRKRSFGKQILTIIITILFALAIGLIISGILGIGFMIQLRPILKIIIGTIALIILVIVFRGILNIKKK